MLSSCLFHQGSDPDDIGIVSDIKESDSGFTFEFIGEDGTYRCFSKERPYAGSVYEIKGRMSDDGTICFVSSMKLLCRF